MFSILRAMVIEKTDETRPTYNAEDPYNPEGYRDLLDNMSAERKDEIIMAALKVNHAMGDGIYNVWWKREALGELADILCDSLGISESAETAPPALENDE